MYQKGNNKNIGVSLKTVIKLCRSTLKYSCSNLDKGHFKSVADPGFPRRVGGANPQMGTPTYYLATFSPKTMKMKEIGPRRWHASLATPWIRQ